MFLKFEHSAVPIEQVRQITVWEKHYEKASVVKLTFVFADGSSYNIDLIPKPKDREVFLEKLLKEISKRNVTDIHVVVEKLLKKEGKK